jgi:hypothetical protein
MPKRRFHAHTLKYFDVIAMRTKMFNSSIFETCPSQISSFDVRFREGRSVGMPSTASRPISACHATIETGEADRLAHNEVLGFGDNPTLPFYTAVFCPRLFFV